MNEDALELPLIESYHCEKCNSDIEQRNFLKITWSGVHVPACPNCSEPIRDLLHVAASPERTGMFCPSCGADLSGLGVSDIPSHYCAFCGAPLPADINSRR